MWGNRWKGGDESPAPQRSEGCIACGSQFTIRNWTVTSPFFAARALLTKPKIIAILKCVACDTQYFDLLVTSIELERLYDGYRGEEYFRQRNCFEPWYTRIVNGNLGGEKDMIRRRSALKRALELGGVNFDFGVALDYGGDRGQMLRDVKASRKAVYEISGVLCDPGIEAVSEHEMQACVWDLILSCHVLEHLTHPAAHVADLISLGAVGTVYFFEVPSECPVISTFNASALHRFWLRWLLKQNYLFKFWDFLSTGLRVQFGVVAPFCFIPLREHLTFFTVSGIRSMLTKQGLSVLYASTLDTGHIGVVAVRR